MKSTFDLYNIDPSSLRNLPYEEALKTKIDGAQFAMRQYRSFADREPNKFGEKYKEWMEKYKASEKALNFTREQLEELNLF